MSTSTELPPAPQQLRQEVFVGIGELATMLPQPRQQQIFSFEMRPVGSGDIPQFITERLPASGQPALFEVKARLHSARPRIPPTAALVVRRTVLHPDMSSATVWRVSYWLEDETQNFAARRTVYGLDYPLPDAPSPETPQQLAQQIADCDKLIPHLDELNLRLTTSEQSGPWPEAGLAVPEGEQLLELVAILQQERRGG